MNTQDGKPNPTPPDLTAPKAANKADPAVCKHCHKPIRGATYAEWSWQTQSDGPQVLTEDVDPCCDLCYFADLAKTHPSYGFAISVHASLATRLEQLAASLDSFCHLLLNTLPGNSGPNNPGLDPCPLPGPAREPVGNIAENPNGPPACGTETPRTPALAPGEVMEPPPPPIGVLLGITPYPPIRGGDPALLKPASNLCGRIVPNPVSATAEL